MPCVAPSVMSVRANVAALVPTREGASHKRLDIISMCSSLRKNKLMRKREIEGHTTDTAQKDAEQSHLERGLLRAMPPFPKEQSERENREVNRTAHHMHADKPRDLAT